MSKRLIFTLAIIILISASMYYYMTHKRSSARALQTFAFLRDPASRPDLMIKAGAQCDSAPFIFPTDGMIGFIWDDFFDPVTATRE